MTEERTAQQQSFSNADELLKRAKLLAVRADQLKTNIAAKRRALFARSLFQRSASIADAGLWIDFWREAPGNVHDVGALFGAWGARINAQFVGWRRSAFWLALPALLLAYIPLARAAMRVLSRSPTVEKPSRFLKVMGAWWIALVIAVPPVALTYAVIYGLDALNLISLRLQSVFAVFATGVVRVAVAIGLARGLLAPTRPNWRLPQISDDAAARLLGVAVSVAAIVSLTRILRSLERRHRRLVGIFGGDPRLRRPAGGDRAGGWPLERRRDAADGDYLATPVQRRLNWLGILRGVALMVAIAVVDRRSGRLSDFRQLLARSGHLDQRRSTAFQDGEHIGEEAIAAGFKPTSRFGELADKSRRLAAQFAGPCRRHSVRRSASRSFYRSGRRGAGALGISVDRRFVRSARGLLWLQSWRRRDFASLNRRGRFHFRSALRGGPCVAALAELKASTAYRPGFGVSAIRSRRASAMSGSLWRRPFALGYLGLSFEKLAIVAGALSVGIGFGLQSIVNNFVSGLILLWERAVRVGDWIIVGGDQGFVRRINVRSTEIETIDRAQVIIPNSSLITGVVKNLVRNDRTGRIVIPVTVAGDADPEKVREVLVRRGERQ